MIVADIKELTMAEEKIKPKDIYHLFILKKKIAVKVASGGYKIGQNNRIGIQKKIKSICIKIN